MANGQQSNTHSRRANYSFVEEQNEARTELLNSKVNQLKHLAVQIGEETKYQNKHLKVSAHGTFFSLTVCDVL
jgi:DNA repair ATPase RecN